MKLLDKLRVAVDFFRYNNPSSMELSHVVREAHYNHFDYYLLLNKGRGKVYWEQPFIGEHLPIVYN